MASVMVDADAHVRPLTAADHWLEASDDAQRYHSAASRTWYRVVDFAIGQAFHRSRVALSRQKGWRRKKDGAGAEPLPAP